MATHSKKALESQWGLTDCKILGQLYLPAKYDPPPFCLQKRFKYFVAQMQQGVGNIPRRFCPH